MSGGNLTSQWRRCARFLGAGLFGGLLISPCGASLGDDGAVEAPTPAASTQDCVVETTEQSIVVQKQRAPLDESEVVVASDLNSGGLEPIANASDYEPELAEPTPAGKPKVPTLADPPANSPAVLPGRTPRIAATEAKPAAQDVCIDETVAGAAAEPAVAIHAASFNGVTPGMTTRAEVIAQWGEPQSTNDSGDMTYVLKNFPQVVVECLGDHVDSVRVTLQQPANTERLAAKLGLEGIRPAALHIETGVRVATAYPERGVRLGHVAEGADLESAEVQAACEEAATAYDITLKAIGAEPFIARAAASPTREYVRRAADLKRALEYDATSAEARFLLSQCRLATGAVAEAERLAAVACDLDARNDQYRLQWAKCLKYLAEYDQAVEQTRLVLEGTTASKLTRAQALEQMALLAALGSKDVQERAIPLHHKAIELADQLATSDDAATRIAAKSLLVDAHLAMADRITAGEYQNKEAAVAEWITQASAMSEEMIAAGEADVSLRLQVALTGLVAGGRLDPPIDPAPWIAEAEQAGADLEATVVDVLARQEIDWQLGLAYFHAAEIQHRRGDAASALKFGHQAETTLSELAESRADLPDASYLLGRTRFQIGAVHAVHHRDHDLACQWYDKAYDDLMQPVPLTTLATPGAHGDALVSMGVSYWEIGSRDRAYELTKAGVTLVGQGVSEGLLASGALAVPKSNLAAMTRALGKRDLEGPAAGGRTQVAQAPQQQAKRGGQASQQQRPARTADRRATGHSSRR